MSLVVINVVKSEKLETPPLRSRQKTGLDAQPILTFSNFLSNNSILTLARAKSSCCAPSSLTVASSAPSDDAVERKSSATTSRIAMHIVAINASIAKDCSGNLIAAFVGLLLILIQQSRKTMISLLLFYLMTLAVVPLFVVACPSSCTNSCYKSPSSTTEYCCSSGCASGCGPPGGDCNGAPAEPGSATASHCVSGRYG